MKSKEPQIRFSGCTDDWKQYKLREIAEFNPKSTLPDKFIYIDLESVSGTNLVSHRTEQKETAPSRAQRLAKRGDVFYQTVRPYQKNNYLFDLPYDNYVFSTGYAQMRPNIDSYFLLSRIQEGKFVSNVLDRCTGTSYPAINSSDLAQIEIGIPTLLEEQTKIGGFFKRLDDTITLHQSEYKKIINLKKAMLHKMFPQNGKSVPEVRFKEFTGDWEQRKLGDCVNYIKGFAFKSEDYRNDGIRIVRVSDLSSNEIKADNEKIFLDSKYEKEYTKYRLNVGDIIITTVGSKAELKESAVGRPIIVKKENEGLLNQNLVKIHPINGYNSDFIYGNLLKENYTNYIASIERGNANQANIAISELWDYTIYLASNEEQEKIGDFFKLLNNNIDLHQEQLNKLQKIKKSMLQKMFI